MITGTTIAYKVTEHDYCLAECIASMMPVCDEIVVVDCSPDDETSYAIRAASLWDAKLRIIPADWNPRPHEKGKWLADLVNHGRSKATGDYHLHLQADEVLHENSYDELRRVAASGKAAYCHRYNFWRDPYHLTPHGKVCGHRIVRCAPMSAPSYGDSESLWSDNPQPSGIEFFHYGFLRKIDAYRKKAIMMEEAIIGCHNEIWDRVPTEGDKPVKEFFAEEELIKFRGMHPALARPWLMERGYQP